MRLSALLILCVMTLCAEQASARFRRPTKPVRILVSGTADVLFANSAADSIAGATYTRNYATPLVLGAGIGVLLHDNWYLGVRGEYWIAERDFDPGSGQQIDTLRYLSVGGEIGIAKIQHRLQLYILGGVGYPIRLEIESTAGTFSLPTKPLSFYGKVVGAISFSSHHAFFAEAGYRLANLGAFSDGATPFLPGGDSLDLSGLFLGLGFHVEF